VRAFAALLLPLLAACPGAPPCAPDGCAEGTVCQLDGTCAALAERPGFARTLHLPAADWAGTRGDARSDRGGLHDELLLGGEEIGGVVWLAFDLPPDGEVVGAVLRLSPAARFAGGTPQRVAAFESSAFDGARVSRRQPPRRVGRYGAERVLASTGRPLRLDVSELVRVAAGPPGQRRRRVHLGVRARSGEGPAWRIASPSALDGDRHPRLELRLRRR